jgi:hypothetical protein
VHSFARKRVHPAANRKAGITGAGGEAGKTGPEKHRDFQSVVAARCSPAPMELLPECNVSERVGSAWALVIAENWQPHAEPATW